MDDESASPRYYDALLEFSAGRLTRGEAIPLLGLRDYAGLLVALGDVNLPMPPRPKGEIDEEVRGFVRLWNESAT